MRASVLSFAFLLTIPALAEAQGSLIPRPGGSSVVKTSSRVSAELVDRVLRYEVTETFLNRGGRVGEADYIFPLPKGAAFQDLKLSINGELVSGETMNAAQARSIYEEIVRRQRDPALVEWMGYGMLRARIFPIAPGEEKRVVVRFQMVAEREGDALRVDYFQGRQNRESWMAFASRTDDDAPRSSFSLKYPTDGIYGSPYSPTHSLSTRRSGRTNEVTASGGGSEVTILLPVRKSTEPAISVLSYAPRNDDGFALITLSPPVLAARPTPRDVTLVLDVSGSMAGIKIRQARDAGKQVLATLRPSDRFKLIDFSTDVRTFRDEFTRATRENVLEATKYLESLDASGSTNISGALDAALDGEAPSGRLGLVLFVTDGAPTVGERNPDAIAARVERLRGDRRIFSFGVGSDLNVALVERLALEGRGTAQFVRPDESVERAVAIVASRLTNPVVTNLRVRADGVRLLKRLPGDATDLFSGQDYVLLTRYDGSGPARLRFEGETAQGPVSWTTRVEFPSSSRENSFVARLWATQRIGYLSAEKRKSGSSREIDDEIKSLGEKYAIPTEFTSYLVVEPGMRRAQSPVLSDVVVTGVATAAPAPSAAAFEAARTAAKQRAAVNLAMGDEADRSKTASTRRVGARVFALQGETWTDLRKVDFANVMKVKAYSAAWFKLVDAIPELREIFALGDKVVVSGRAISITVGADGVVSLDDNDLRRIQSQW
ncbi:MAG TPA: VIT domain-containing protein [Gemmatimonadaceae bacterium]|nr:VIT domain-containing protein [Gemmatimonadaceae bacterium]